MALDTSIGSAAADSYGTLAAYTAYGTALGRTLAATEAENEVNLRKGALFLANFKRGAGVGWPLH